MKRGVSVLDASFGPMRLLNSLLTCLVGKEVQSSRYVDFYYAPTANSSKLSFSRKTIACKVYSQSFLLGYTYKLELYHFLKRVAIAPEEDRSSTQSLYCTLSSGPSGGRTVTPCSVRSSNMHRELDSSLSVLDTFLLGDDLFPPAS